MIPERSSMRTCSSAEGNVMWKGSASFEIDIAPPCRSLETILRLIGKPSASSINAAFFFESPGEYILLFSRSATNLSSARFCARIFLSLARCIRRGFQYLVINLSMGVGVERDKGVELITVHFTNAE